MQGFLINGNPSGSDSGSAVTPDWSLELVEENVHVVLQSEYHPTTTKISQWPTSRMIKQFKMFNTVIICCFEVGHS